MKLSEESLKSIRMRRQSNLLAWWKSRGNKTSVPLPQTPTPLKMEIEMTKLNELIALSRKLLAELLAARADIATLKDINKTYADRITVLEDANAAADAEAAAFIDEAMPAIDAGGSTGNVIG